MSTTGSRFWPGSAPLHCAAAGSASGASAGRSAPTRCLLTCSTPDRSVQRASSTDPSAGVIEGYTWKSESSSGPVASNPSGRTLEFRSSGTPSTRNWTPRSSGYTDVSIAMVGWARTPGATSYQVASAAVSTVDTTFDTKVSTALPTSGAVSATRATDTTAFRGNIGLLFSNRPRQDATVVVICSQCVCHTNAICRGSPVPLAVSVGSAPT